MPNKFKMQAILL